MKRFFLFVAALCCMGMMSVNALAEKVYDESSKLYFELDDATSTAIVVEDNSGSDNYNYLSGKVTIPAEITYSAKDYTVTTIGKYAFRNNTTITEYVLPEDGALATIESAAFDQSAVEKINIPSTVTAIPYSSFYKSALYNNDGNYEDGILYIDGCLIAAKTSLEGEVTVNVGTRLIAGSAFTGCKNITEVKLPEGVTYIGCNAFNNCSALEQINFPASLNFIGDNAFLNCKLREVYLKSPLTIGKMAFFATTPSIQTVVLPKGESTFEDYAFSGQPGITRINVYEKDPSKLHMGTGVFDDVDKEKCIVYVPHELNGGSVSDFKATDEWSTFIIQSNNVCADGLFFELNDVTKKMTLTYELYDSYFNYCTLEENVDMVSNIHAIHALDELGYTLTNVGARAFEFASQITSITLPETVEHIGMMAFSDLNQMKEFTIPEKVNFIGEFAFAECTGLEKITNLNPVPQDITGKSVFYGVKKTEVKLMVPTGSRTAYLLADTWGSFDIEEMPIRIGDLYYYLNDEDDYAEVTYQYELSEDNYAFLPENTKLVIPSEVTYNEKTYPVWYITSGAFQNCNQIKEVEIPGSVLIVGSSAFNGCKNLESATLNEGVKSLEMSVFEGCSNLWQVSLPSTLKQIDNYMFKGCEHFSRLYVYNPKPFAISDKVFEDVDKSQVRLYIPYGSKDDYLAAEVWNELGKEDEEHHYIVEMSNGVKVDGLYYIFDKVNKTATFTFNYFYAAANMAFNYLNIDPIPSTVTYEEEEYTVTSIGDYAFWDSYCYVMEIPVGVSSIGNYAFANVYNGSLYLIVNNETPIDIAGKHVFENTSQDILVVPAGSAQAYKEAEGWKDFETIIEKGAKVGELYYHFDRDAKTAMVTFEKYNDDDNYNSLPEELIIPEKVTYDEVEYTATEIEQNAFLYCKSLKKVTLPATLEKIGDEAFFSCSSLSSITCYAVEPPVLGDDVFGSIKDRENIPLYVCKASIDKYKAAEQWKEFIVEEMSNGVKVGQLYYIFDKVNKTATVTYEKYKDDKNYKSLPEELIIPEKVSYDEVEYTVTAIGDYAFWSAYTSFFEIPASITSIGEYAFANIIFAGMILNSEIPIDIQGKHVFENTIQELLLLPAGSAQAYKAAEGWKDFSLIIEQGIKVGNLYYSFNKEEKTATVTFEKYVNQNNYKSLPEELIIPEKVSYDEVEYTVTTIGDDAFLYCESVKKVTLPATIQKLGKEAFEHCSSISEMTCYAAEPPVLGQYAFYGIDCKSALLYVPKASIDKYENAEQWKEFVIVEMSNRVKVDELYYIFDEVNKTARVTFEKFNDENNYKSLPEELIIPENVTYAEVEYAVTAIGDDAFLYCESVKKVTLPATIQKLGKEAFEHCSSISEMTCYAAEPPVLGEDVFYGYDCSKITLYVPKASIDKYEAAEQWKEFDIKAAPMCGDHLLWEIKDGVLTITGNGDMWNWTKGNHVPWFNYHGEITSVQLPGGLTSIGDNAFYGCESLTSIDIPAGVTSIGDNAFGACKKLTSIAIPVGVTTIGTFAFDYCSELTSINVSEENEHYCDIDGVLFNKQKTVLVKYPERREGNSYTVPEGVTKLEIRAFRSADLLETIILPKGITKIEAYTFSSADLLETIILPDGLTSIGASAFSACKKLVSIDFPASVTNIDILAFNDCIALTSVTCRAVEPPVLGTHVFDGSDCSKIPLYVPKASIDKYKAADQWKEFAQIDSYDATVTFLDKDGNLIEEQYVVKGEGAVAPDAPEVEGYHFTGWDPADLSSVTEDLTVKATYAINTYTVKFYDHSDNVISTQTVNWNEAALEPELADWEGHTFTSWSVEFDHVKSDLDIKPIYDVEVYKVTFLGFNDIELKVENVEYGGSATAPDAPDVEGYTFIGWDKEFDNVTSDLTVKAKYEINHYALTLVAGHGTIAITDESGEHSLNPDMVMHGTIVKLIVTADDGYLFKGWSDSNTDNPRYVTVTEDKTFTALFEKEPDDPTGVEEVESQKSEVKSTKLLRDGVLYILREGKMYNAQGQKVQ